MFAVAQVIKQQNPAVEKKHYLWGMISFWEDLGLPGLCLLYREYEASNPFLPSSSSRRQRVTVWLVFGALNSSPGSKRITLLFVTESWWVLEKHRNCWGHGLILEICKCGMRGIELCRVLFSGNYKELTNNFIHYWSQNEILQSTNHTLSNLHHTY